MSFCLHVGVCNDFEDKFCSFIGFQSSSLLSLVMSSRVRVTSLCYTIRGAVKKWIFYGQADCKG